MAKIFPAALPHTRLTGGLIRELDVIERLSLSLPDGYEIFHHVSLHAPSQEGDRHGEIDVIVLAPRGTVLLMEIKAGSVELRNGRIFKRYVDSECDVERQMGFQFGALLARLKDARLKPYVSHCLVLPDWSLEGAGTVSLPPERVIDARDYDQMGWRVQEMLYGGWSFEDMDALRRFLRNEFEVIPDLGAIQAQLGESVRTLADGLATWIPRIQVPSGVIAVQATAGSGKTQLALRLLEDAKSTRKRALYVCFNRPLADRLLQLAPVPDAITTFHELCIEHYRRTCGEPNFFVDGFFAIAVAEYLSAAKTFSGYLDVIVVDEAQDLEPGWIEALMRLLKDDGQFTLLGDEDQRLYVRDDWEITDSVQVQAFDNFRSPRRICDFINALSLTSRPIRSLCPFLGELPDVREYSSDSELLALTNDAVGRFLKQGFTSKEIVVVSGRGLKNSRFSEIEAIAGLPVRRFTGQYDTAGNAQFVDGELLVESVYRFKGQSAPAVVLTECDFESLDALSRRKLFVGVTRAQMAVSVVASARAVRALESELRAK